MCALQKKIKPKSIKKNKIIDRILKFEKNITLPMSQILPHITEDETLT